jgi:hypothetical protein
VVSGTIIEFPDYLRPNPRLLQHGCRIEVGSRRRTVLSSNLEADRSPRKNPAPILGRLHIGDHASQCTVGLAC